MKLAPVTFVVGFVAALVALALTLVSAPRYGPLFLAIIALDVLAVACLVQAFGAGNPWRLGALVIVAVLIYTVSDVVARGLFGVRVLELFR